MAWRMGDMAPKDSLWIMKVLYHLLLWCGNLFFRSADSYPLQPASRPISTQIVVTGTNFGWSSNCQISMYYVEEVFLRIGMEEPTCE
jgi:hypothetical protein